MTPIALARRRSLLLSTSVLALLLVFESAYAAPELCGDHDDNGVVSATDALLVLKSAVGQSVSLQCPACPSSTTTTTTTLGGSQLEVRDNGGAEDLCGDDDRSGAVAASDALLVLKSAVGHDVTLLCPGCFGELVLEAVHSGFYDQTGRHQVGNYAVGWYGVPNDDELRDYFVFVLPPISGTITSAVLRLSTAPFGFIRYGSDDPSETYTLVEVTTGLESLADGSAAVAAFDDLGEGVSYGELVATSALGDIVDIPLDATGIAFLTAAVGRVGIGGAITTLSKGNPNEFLFNSTSAALTRQLILNVE